MVEKWNYTSRKSDLILTARPDTLSLETCPFLTFRFYFAVFYCIRFPCAHPNTILTSVFRAWLPSTPNTWHVSVGLVGKCVVWEHSAESWPNLLSMLSLLQQTAILHQGYGVPCPKPEKNSNSHALFCFPTTAISPGSARSLSCNSSKLKSVSDWNPGTSAESKFWAVFLLVCLWFCFSFF